MPLQSSASPTPWVRGVWLTAEAETGSDRQSSDIVGWACCSHWSHGQAMKAQHPHTHIAHNVPVSCKLGMVVQHVFDLWKVELAAPNITAGAWLKRGCTIVACASSFNGKRQKGTANISFLNAYRVVEGSAFQCTGPHAMRTPELAPLHLAAFYHHYCLVQLCAA